ncbi:MAG: hypothetical protein PUG10_05770 [Lachnospiraceae bacterium]|nr:hypothetical protein [Lachnospiraceae bacterium]
MKKKKENSLLKNLILAFFFVGIILVYFNHLSNNASRKRTTSEKTDIETLVEYDMQGNYPKTPRDVVKLHCRYMKLFYSKKLEDIEIKELNSKVIGLYSSELMRINTEETIYADLKANIKDMKKEGYVYLMYTLPEISQIKTYTKDGKNMATMEVEIALDTKEQKGYMYIQYVLVKENEQWKILAWGESKLNN